MVAHNFRESRGKARGQKIPPWARSCVPETPTPACTIHPFECNFFHFSIFRLRCYVHSGIKNMRGVALPSTLETSPSLDV